MTFGHLGTGTGMAQPIPKLWEREREWKIAFPTFGNGNENSIPNFWEREREWKIAFPTFGNGNGNENSIPNFWEREWKFHSRTLGTGMRHCYSREWPGTGISSQNWVNIFIIPLFNASTTPYNRYCGKNHDKGRSQKNGVLVGRLNK